MKLLLIAALTVIDPVSAVRPNETVTDMFRAQFPNGASCVIEFTPEELAQMPPGPLLIRNGKQYRCNSRDAEKKTKPPSILA
ncbi:hypothetical protein IPT12_15080 [Xanthomonas perforans]|jgi:hypothetical protein|uniref:Uncharacterized protein n=7 Tax=Xanthomonas TaxID=338 RepID=A0A6V7FHW4_9XANT|nr:MULTISPECIES: hypothetical protein [Xanthomonas]MEB1846182.1 hypothetical protein [Xanthomonas campestris pv. campestris]APP78120.1 hypothetical protein BJD12_22560 [Xanthomonas vesicatoria ATCC 35937]APP82589.1 hypothetical protein BJD10_23165 [Xanthomonas hortorum pv. gardneri]APP87303.1 hypothetical protein BI317_24900 [Xanthomonas hortorum pv. gardneri]APR13225.1 hypothetical protein BI314_23570 [Xanthomonas citri pv. citri]